MRRRSTEACRSTEEMPYYLIQSIAVLAWWASLSLSPTVLAAFQYDGIAHGHFNLFFMPDMVVIAGLSLFAWRRPEPIIKATLIGAFAYASTWCIAASWTTTSGYLGTALMILAFLANIFALIGHKCFYRNSSTSTLKDAIQTFIQSLIIWIFFLLVIPILILDAFNKWPITFHPIQSLTGAIVFVLFSALGVMSARALVMSGKGTPLPMNAPKLLVITGPYKYVRNPMAVAGLGQGIAVSIISNSLEIAVYCFMGMVAWNYLVRPVEEADLENTFGDQYREYSRKIRCWIPTT